MPNTSSAILTALAAVLISAGTAAADPTPGPWQPGPNGPIEGVQQYPAICATQPLACAMHYDINRGAWVPNG